MGSKFIVEFESWNKLTIKTLKAYKTRSKNRETRDPDANDAFINKLQCCNVVRRCLNLLKVAKSCQKLPTDAISCYNVQIETSIFEYANWPRLQI